MAEENDTQQGAGTDDEEGPIEVTTNEAKNEPTAEASNETLPNDEQAAAEPVEERSAKKTGIALVAEAVDNGNSDTKDSPSAGIGDGDEDTEEGEGKGLFYPDMKKVQEQQETAKEEPEPTANQQDTPIQEVPVFGEGGPAKTRKEPRHPTTQRPPPPSVTSEGDSAPPQPPKPGRPTGVSTDQVYGQIMPRPSPDKKPRFALALDNLGRKDINYICFIAKYLYDKGYIQVEHPVLAVKFAINLTLQVIKEEIEAESG